jgi:hypothetical protein
MKPAPSMSMIVASVSVLAVLGGTCHAALAASAVRLPPGTLRGSEHRLLQYPTVSLATPAQRVAAQRLRADLTDAVSRWDTLEKARAAGFDTSTAARRVGDTSVHYLHAEHESYRHDPTHLDPLQPKALIYANIPPFPLVLVGVMFSMPRGERGLTPGGPITRWHTHRVCARGNQRGLTPRHDGSCPPGTSARQGSEMLHFWLTDDLRSAFAIHAPTRELGLAGLLPDVTCQVSRNSA